ncbi:enoyl-CoA hydratase/isomerase family protein [Catenulispora rubra]|uniref:enoyl-CoA hydratase/isomerase family protein n=1 Tax=Catenulispora rubra TaxID=280293 RepID=UPI0018920EF9|nr:enoyl-CoA hydratase/isomerase family protein [Catenulispora rubra]
MPKPTALSIGDLAGGAADIEALAEDGSIVDPLMIVELDRGGVSETELSRAVERARGCDRVLIGTTNGVVSDALVSLAEALDLTLAHGSGGLRCAVEAADPESEAMALRRNAEVAPQAALVLAQVLRIGESLPVRQALDVESLAYSTLLAGPGFARWLAARGERPEPPSRPGETVIIRRYGGTLHLTLNRPERRNAHSRDLRDALVAGLRVAELDDSVAAVVLDGNGPSFCSGGDLDEFGTALDLTTAHLVRTRAGAARPLHALRDRLTARIHGHCVGAGIELPAFAGRVVADPGTVMRLPELEMGLIPGAGGTVSFPRRIGRWRTAYMVLSGEPVSAAFALAWGLVDGIEPVIPEP